MSSICLDLKSLFVVEIVVNPYLVGYISFKSLMEEEVTRGSECALPQFYGSSCQLCKSVYKRVLKISDSQRLYLVCEPKARLDA